MNEKYMNQLLLTATDVKEILSCGRTSAYKLIRQLNAELAEKGYAGIIPGKIPTKYFFKRVPLL